MKKLTTIFILMFALLIATNAQAQTGGLPEITGFALAKTDVQTLFFYIKSGDNFYWVGFPLEDKDEESMVYDEQFLGRDDLIIETPPFQPQKRKRAAAFRIAPTPTP